MNIRPPLIASALLAASLMSGAAQAALQGRDLNGSSDSFEAYYDTDLNITWLKNANLAASNTFGVSGINYNGTMNWDTANRWVAAMNTANYLGHNDWRLPSVTDGPCPYLGYSGGTCGWNPDTSTGEMAHLFYDEFKNTSFYDTAGAYPQAGWFQNNTGPFIGLQPKFYWSGTAYAQYPSINSYAWGFDFGSGVQGFNSKNQIINYAMVVLPGDVAAVPEADTWAMLLAGLGLVGAAARRRKPEA